MTDIRKPAVFRIAPDGGRRTKTRRTIPASQISFAPDTSKGELVVVPPAPSGQPSVRFGSRNVVCAETADLSPSARGMIIQIAPAIQAMVCFLIAVPPLTKRWGRATNRSDRDSRASA